MVYTPRVESVLYRTIPNGQGPGSMSTRACLLLLLALGCTSESAPVDRRYRPHQTSPPEPSTTGLPTTETTDTGTQPPSDRLCLDPGIHPIAQVAQSFMSVDAHDHAGNTLANLGDTNGDGIDDLLVGSDNAGEVWLIHGDSGLNSGALPNRAAAILRGQPGGTAGSSISAAGDQDGDGLGDFWVGDPFMEGDRGGAYLISGATATSGTNLESLAIARLFGDAGHHAGRVTHVGDVTGDGISDVTLGGDPHDSFRGIVYVFAGPFSGDIDSTSAFATFTGIEPNDRMSRSISPGDLNGDGYSDLVLAAQEAGGRSGAAYLIAGPISPGPQSAADIESTIVGENGELLGHSMAGSGDVTGDGLDDFVIGAPYADDKAGRTYVFSGIPTGEVTAFSTAQTTIFGESNADRAGSSVAKSGDLDQDGFLDLQIGAKYEATQGQHAGALYLLRGPFSATEHHLGTDGYDAKLIAQGPYDLLSRSSSGGDFNGDGQPDVLVGAKLFGGAATNAGAAYVVLCP